MGQRERKRRQSQLSPENKEPQKRRAHEPQGEQQSGQQVMAMPGQVTYATNNQCFTPGPGQLLNNAQYASPVLTYTPQMQQQQQGHYSPVISQYTPAMGQQQGQYSPVMSQYTPAMGPTHNNDMSTIMQRLVNIDLKLSQLDDIQLSVNRINTRLDTIDQKVAGMEVKMKGFEESRQYDSVLLEDLQKKQSELSCIQKRLADLEDKQSRAETVRTTRRQKMERRSLRKRRRSSPEKSARLGLDFDCEASPKKRRLSQTKKGQRRYEVAEDVENKSSESDSDQQSFTIKSFYGGRDQVKYPHSPSRRKAVAKVLDKYCEQGNSLVVSANSLVVKPIQTKSYTKRSRSVEARYEFRTSSSEETEPEWQPRVVLKGLSNLNNKTKKQKVKLDVKKVAKTKAKEVKKMIEVSSVENLKVATLTDSEKTPVLSGKKFFKSRSPGSADRGSVLIKKGFKLQFVARRLSIPKTPKSSSKVKAPCKQTRTKHVPSIPVSSGKITKTNNKLIDSGEKCDMVPVTIKDTVTRTSNDQNKTDISDDQNLLKESVLCQKDLSKVDQEQASKVSDVGLKIKDDYKKVVQEQAKQSDVGLKIKDDCTDSAIDTAHSEDLFSSLEVNQEDVVTETEPKGAESPSSKPTVTDDAASSSVNEDSLSAESGRSTPLSLMTESSSEASPVSQCSLESGPGTGTPMQKLFPIFTARRVSPPSSGSKSLSRRGSPAGTSLKRLKKGKETKEQMIIDAGQKKYGMTQCDRCNMVYTHDSQEDAALHEKFHQQVLHCLKFTGWKTERVVQEYADGSRVVMVSADDQVYKKKKVEEVNSLMSEELGFSDVPISNRLFYKAFLSISHNKTIEGCCMTEEVNEGYPVLPDSPCNSEHSLESANHPAHRPWYCSDTPQKASIGISRIWVHNSCRKTGVATKLLDCVRHWAIYGMVIPKNRVAFSDPTPDGRILATKYTGIPSFLVYKYRDV